MFIPSFCQGYQPGQERAGCQQSIQKGSLLQLISSHCSFDRPGLQKTLQPYVVVSPVEAKEPLALSQVWKYRRVLRVALYGCGRYRVV